MYTKYILKSGSNALLEMYGYDTHVISQCIKWKTLLTSDKFHTHPSGYTIFQTYFTCTKTGQN